MGRRGTGERFVPYVIEPALGVNRSMLTFMIDAYDEEVVGERERTVLRLHPQLAPVKAAILPLIGKDTAMVEKARLLYEELRRQYSVEYDDNGAIGRRYRRQDEIGTPYASRSTSRRSRTTRSPSATGTRSRRSGCRSRACAAGSASCSPLSGGRRSQLASVRRRKPPWCS